MSREKNLCIFIGHEVGLDDDIIIFIDLHAHSHISSQLSDVYYVQCLYSIFV